MFTTQTIPYALLWVAATLFACNKDNNIKPLNETPETHSAINIETAPIPTAFRQNVLLTGFSATWCGSCPGMDDIFHQVKNNFPDRVSCVIHHDDGLQSPGDDSLFRFFKIRGLPAWYYFPVSPDSTSFSKMSQRIGVSLNSYAVGDTMYVKVVTGFAIDIHSPVKIAVFLTEDNIKDNLYAQSSTYYGDAMSSYYKMASPIKNFRHDYVLRKTISASVLGDVISPSRTVARVRDIREYSLYISPGYKKENLKIIAFAYTGVYLYGFVNNVNEAAFGKTSLW